MKKTVRRNIFYTLILFITLVISFSISFFSFSSRENLSLAASNQQIIVTNPKDTTAEINNVVQAPEDDKSKVTPDSKKHPVDSEQDIQKEIQKVNSEDNKKSTDENKSNENSFKEEKPKADNNTANEKVAYLTFDDGPSLNITPQILDILKNNKVRATFFVIGSMAEKNPDLVKRAKDEGHAIANHTYSHDFNYVYSEPQNFLNDIVKSETVLKKIIPDYSNKNIRFPGGSFGEKRKPFRDLMQSLGYNSIDWNCLNGDAEALNVPPDKLLSKVKETYKGQKNLIVLMHDAPSKSTTVQALPHIIQFLQSQGYTFKTFD